MALNNTSIALVVAVCGAAGYAFYAGNHTSSSASTAATASTAAAAPAREPSREPAGRGADEPLPPNHPSVGRAEVPTHGGQMGDMPQPAAAAEEDTGALKWTAPSAWASMPNPSAMRLATYKVPHLGSDTDDADLSISRAGGDTSANIARWVGQFEGAGKESRQTKKVQGMNVTVVEVSGTYAGGMGPASQPRKDWALLGAIVEAPGQPYFFKLTGPMATVHASRKLFDTMLDSLVQR